MSEFYRPLTIENSGVIEGDRDMLEIVHCDSFLLLDWDSDGLNSTDEIRAINNDIDFAHSCRRPEDSQDILNIDPLQDMFSQHHEDGLIELNFNLPSLADPLKLFKQ